MFNKFHAKKTTVDGITFDSKKEAKRWSELQFLERYGIITNLERQKRFTLLDKYTNNKGESIRGIEYIADFCYYDTQKKQWVVEDTKGFRTDVYKIKKKLFEQRYPAYRFEEI